MTATIVLTALAGLLAQAAAQPPSVNVSIATVPVDSRVNLNLIPNGEAEIRQEPSGVRVRIQIDRAEPLTTFGPDLRAWVVWAVTPEGEFANLGELEPDGNRARLETMTSYSRLGILVTAEPHFLVSEPSANVAFRSGTARRDETRIDPLRVDVGTTHYSGLTLPPQGNIHRRVTQARMAVALAEREITSTISSPRLREARVALDSLEQLLRRETPLSIVLPYANDAIRLSDLAVREERARSEQLRLEDALERIERLEASLDSARQALTRSEDREREATSRNGELVAQIESVRDANRDLTIERDSVTREKAGLEAQVRELENPWPPLEAALVTGFGARRTPRGLVMTLPPSAFDADGLRPETREWMSRLGGALAFGEVPEVWVEGHSVQDRALEVSEERARAVGDYLIATGLSATRVQARGLGDSSPIPGAEEAGAGDLNERVEIIIREFGSL
jgi:flagellar motor protein MotB